jgi:hypothetical protein
MKTFNASDLAHKRTEIFNAAKAEGAILQRKNTNGVVLEEFLLINNNPVLNDKSFGQMVKSFDLEDKAQEALKEFIIDYNNRK